MGVEPMRELAGLPALGAETIQVADYFCGNAGAASLLSHGGFSPFKADLSKLAAVEPVPSAVGAFVDFYSALGAIEVPPEFDLVTPRAFALAGRVDHNSFVAPDGQQRLARGFVLLIDTLKFESIEPNAAATILANVHYQFTYLHLR